MPSFPRGHMALWGQQSRSEPRSFHPKSQVRIVSTWPECPSRPPRNLEINFHISKWDLPMLSIVMDEFYAVLWSIQLNSACFIHMPSSSAYQEDCYEQWVSNLVKFWTGITAMVHCKIIIHSPFHKAKKSTNYLSLSKHMALTTFN